MYTTAPMIFTFFNIILDNTIIHFSHSSFILRILSSVDY